MKIRNILILTFLFNSLLSFAQYDKLTVDAREWSEYTIGQIQPIMNYYTFRGDTVIKGDTLPRLIKTDKAGAYLSTIYAVKEDSSSPSITFYPIDSSEAFGFLYGDSLFLDLSLNVGDSSMINCGGTDTTYYVLDSTGTYTDLTNKTRKQYFFHINVPIGAEALFNWTEGLGSIGMGGVVYFVPITCLSDVRIPRLLCVKDQGLTQLYQNPNYDSCSVPISIGEKELRELQVFPNPAKDFVTFKNIEISEVVEVSVFTNDGKEVIQAKGLDQNRLAISALKPGVYMVKVTFRDKSQGLIRLVKE